MRPRFGISGSVPGDNSMLSSVSRWQHADRLKEEYKKTRQLRKDQKHLWDTSASTAQQFINAQDDEIAGITELGVLKSNGRGGKDIDDTINGSVVIGDREHKMSAGTVRIISKQAVDDAVIPILEERRFKDAVMSAILADRSGRICRMMLSQDRYQMLQSNNTTITTISPNIPAEIRAADARPEFFTFYHESSKEWALAVQKLSIVVDNTSIVYDGDIMDWLGAYGDVKKNNPVGT